MPVDFYYCAASAPCRNVAMTAKMVGVELDMKAINIMAGEHMAPDYVALNPQHNIPFIVDGDIHMNESRAITAYLVNQYAKDDTLYPKCPKARAIVDQRLYFDMGVLYHRFGELYYPLMWAGATKLCEKAQKNLAEAIGFLELFLGKNKYAAGDHLTIADISLVATVSTIEAVDKSHIENHPKIKSWLEACKAEITDYQEANQQGADFFGGMVQNILSKLQG